MIHEYLSGSRRRLLILLGTIFLTRLLFAALMWKINGSSVFFTPDSPEYVEPAQSLLRGSYSFEGNPEIFRTPGYSVLLIPAVLSGHVALIGLFENWLLAVASGWLVWKIANAVIRSDRAAFWAVCFYCFEPMSFLQSEKIMSDLAFATVLLLCLWMFVLFLSKPSYARLAFSSLVLGAATYIRPAVIYWWVFLVPVLLFFPSGISRPRRFLMAMLFPMIYLAALSPWIIRNMRVADYGSFSATGDVDSYFYIVAAIEARLENKEFVQVNRELGWADQDRYFQLHPEQRTWSQGRIIRFQRTTAREMVAKHLGLYTVIHAQGCVRTILNPGVTELLIDLGLYSPSTAPVSRKLDQGFLKSSLWLIHEYPWAAIFLPIMAVQLLIYYVLALVGASKLALDIRCLFFAAIVYFVLISGIPGSVSRWRTPFMPVICICAGCALLKTRILTSRSMAS